MLRLPVVPVGGGKDYGGNGARSNALNAEACGG